MDFSGEVRRLRTLIVEDNAAFRGTLKDSLQTLFPSMVIHEAAEGNEALQKVETFHPELIFMDIRLPGENGLQLTRKIKGNYPETRVIILTGYDTQEYREAAVRCGADCFIAKDSMNWEILETFVKSFNRIG
jgi:DNA-binding NarL/FixJ family response regulator